MAAEKGKAWAHFVAIGGTGMGALAGSLKDLGFFVTGSDGPLYPPMSTFLESKEIPLVQGYQADNLEGTKWGLSPGSYPDLVVVGNAISKSNVEAQEVERLVFVGRSRRMSFAQALAEYGIGQKRSYVVAGTHGKTTTTSLLSWAFEALSYRPSYFIGGIPKNFDQGCRVTDSEVFVSEGDEYDTAYWDKESKFLHYRPSWVLCTGIEFDHADIYSSVEAIENSFLKLTSKTREGWLLVDDVSAPRLESVQKVAAELQLKGILCHRYGESADSRYRLLSAAAAEISWDSGKIGTKICFECPEFGSVHVISPMIGKHNALNALGVIGVLLASGVLRSMDEVQGFLKGFHGVKRRQEEVYSSQDLVVIDDFAHHPTAIRETIAAIRTRYPKRKLAAFFEPRSATSARNILFDDFVKCFDGADAVFLVQPTKTNVPDEQKLNVGDLVAQIQARPALAGKKVLVVKEIYELPGAYAQWHREQKQATLALIMSNGPFGGLHGLIPDVLHKKS